ncbi:hypothetical protein HMPREF1981_01798 [Bacteroides pyogenes F0041]|uniref:Uncharacterized protein n=1 Tax=Bacteroides pyogenes F0041 TaxID=1321819 RepID=U2CLE1_9BACE|nr:hypothetical protein HMPREF1981_01798 [Bacteroides pyogenes F0041]
MATAQYLYRKKRQKRLKAPREQRITRSSKKLHSVIGKDLFHDKKDSVKSWKRICPTTRKKP